MKRTICRFAALVLSSFFAMDSAWSVKADPLFQVPRPTSAAPASSVATQAGTLTSIDPGSGILVLDGARRFAFSARAVTVRQHNGASGTLAEVKPGTLVSLTLIKSAADASPRVSELWIVR